MGSGTNLKYRCSTGRTQRHNPAMADAAHWHPVLPAHAARAGAAPRSVRLRGQDLVVWRSAAGALQAWHARCPHRGVHLGLGRVVGERLACAYHGWEFAAGNGRCVAIPALADLPAVPGQVHAGVCAAHEAGGMAWVCLDADAGGAPAAGLPAGDDGPGRYLRMLVLRAPLPVVHARLRAAGFGPLAEAIWRGTPTGQPLQLYLHPVDDGLTGACAWASPAPQPHDLDTALADLRALRRAIEADPFTA